MPHSELRESVQDWAAIRDAAPILKQKLADATTIACVAHQDADADSLGSALAMVLSLRAAGKKAYCVCPTPFPKSVSYLPGYALVHEAFPDAVDLVMTFDCPTLSRFGDRRTFVETAASVIVVDHHASHEAFGDLRIIEPTASATGQMVWSLLAVLELPMSPEIATNLYAALFTDTGGFRHENTTEATLRIGAALVACGVNAGWVAQMSYKSKNLAQVRLTAHALGSLQAELDGRLLWSHVSQEMLRTTHAELADTEGIIDDIQSIDTMEMGILFKESSPEVTKMSVRTRDPLDATKLCEPFGGGGHHRASGAEMAMPLAEAEKAVLELARTLVGATQKHVGQ